MVASHPKQPAVSGLSDPPEYGE